MFPGDCSWQTVASSGRARHRAPEGEEDEEECPYVFKRGTSTMFFSTMSWVQPVLGVVAGLHTTMSFFMSTFFSAGLSGGLSGGLRRPPRCPSSCLRVGRVDASTRLACGTAKRVGLVRSQDRNSESLSIEWVGLQPALDVGKGGSGLALRWPSGANTPHQRAQPGSPRTHTRHAQHQTKGRPCWLYPTPWIPVCVARVVWRAKAI